MKKAGLIAFIIALAADLVGVYLQNQILIYAAKPLVVISLIIYFLAATRGTQSGFTIIIVRALIFSWLGDVLLMFESLNSKTFLPGLLAFLFAHLIYIRFFSIIRKGEKISLKPVLVLAVAAYYAGLVFLLFNHLQDMKLPVMVYGAVISIMFLLALHTLYIKNRVAGKQLMLGALLFVVSDSILAYNKFLQPFENAGIFIMLTYGIAQLLITRGAAHYIQSVSKQ